MIGKEFILKLKVASKYNSCGVAARRTKVKVWQKVENEAEIRYCKLQSCAVRGLKYMPSCSLIRHLSLSQREEEPW